MQNMQTKRERHERDDEDPLQGITPSRKGPNNKYKLKFYIRPTTAVNDSHNYDSGSTNMSVGDQTRWLAKVANV